MATPKDHHDAAQQDALQELTQAASVCVRPGAGPGTGSATRSATRSTQAISAGDWVGLLEVVAAGQMQLVLRVPNGARVVLVAERELLDLQEAAAESVRVVLTGREREVLLAVEEGLAVSAVAERLGIAQGTAVQHLAAARRKFGVGTSAQAAAWAREIGQLG